MLELGVRNNVFQNMCRQNWLKITSCVEFYNFTCCSVWMRNLVSHTEGGTKTEGVRE
jgi:hypothetical protein